LFIQIFLSASRGPVQGDVQIVEVDTGQREAGRQEALEKAGRDSSGQKAQVRNWKYIYRPGPFTEQGWRTWAQRLFLA